MRRFSAFVVLPLVGCMAAPAQLAPELLTVHVDAPPAAVQTAIARVAAVHGFTLVPFDRASGVIQTQPLEVQTRWEGVKVTDRVTCGTDLAGVDKAELNPVQVTLAFITTADSTGTSVRLRPTSSTYSASARTLARTNAAAGAFTDTTPCELRAPFVQGLLAEVGAAARTP